MISTCSGEINIEISVMTFGYTKDNEAFTLPLSASTMILNIIFIVALVSLNVQCSVGLSQT